MDKENRSFGQIKMYPVFQLNLVNGAMGLAELSNNSGGVPTTFEKTVVLVTIVGENMMRLKRKSSKETFIFVCLKMFREGHTRWAQIPHAVYFPPEKSARLTFAV